MARSFRQSRFRRHDDIGEDVNPSAYIVNLADCMLVLACGFMVAMMTHWNINLSSAEELESDQLSEVAPETLSSEDLQNGSYYLEAGSVYQDPNTGQYYMVKKNAAELQEGKSKGSSSKKSGKNDAASQKSDDAKSSDTSSASAGDAGNAGSGGASAEGGTSARAAGAD